MPDFTYDVGRVSFIMKGAWNLATSYEKLDAVSYNGSLYIAKQNVPGGTAITNTTYWQLAAEKGDQGDTGGVDSVNGQQGDVWFPDSRQLISDGYTTDTAPFLMKGNDSDSDRFELAKKLGNTVGVNQLVQNGNFSDGTTGWTASGATLSASNNELTATATSNTTPNLLKEIKITNGHHYMVCFAVYPQETMTAVAFFLDYEGSVSFRVENIAGGSWKYISQVATASATKTAQMTAYFNYNNANNGKVTKFKQFAIIDLDIWFGSPDRIPSDLLSHPENWGRYYAGSLAYNAGTLESADGTVMRSIGRNLFDISTSVSGEWINPSTGAFASANNSWRSDYIPTIPNTEFFLHGIAATMNSFVAFYDVNQQFISRTGASASGDRTVTTPGNCFYIAFCNYVAGAQTYTDTRADVTFSLYYPGESGYDQYYPHQVLAEVDTGSEVLYGDGTPENSDVKLPSGAITRKRQRDNLGDIAWTLRATGSVNKLYSGSLTKNYLGYNSASDMAGKVITAPIAYAGISNAALLIAAVDTSDVGLYTLYNYGAETNAVYLVLPIAADPTDDRYIEYTVATPTTEQGTAFEPLVVTVKNGVLSWTNTKGIPVGQESHWFENLRKRVEDRLPDPPSADGTYRLTCTISGGVKTYSWEA